MNKYPNLFSPIKLGDLTLRNRIIPSANGRSQFNTRGIFDSGYHRFLRVDSGRRSSGSNNRGKLRSHQNEYKPQPPLRYHFTR